MSNRGSGSSGALLAAETMLKSAGGNLSTLITLPRTAGEISGSIRRNNEVTCNTHDNCDTAYNKTQCYKFDLSYMAIIT